MFHLPVQASQSDAAGGYFRPAQAAGGRIILRLEFSIVAENAAETHLWNTMKPPSIFLAIINDNYMWYDIIQPEKISVGDCIISPSLLGDVNN